MAEKNIKITLTQEINKPDGGNSRRNSIGKPSSSNSGEKILPHYLRASTGSCHDFCKYGRKHAFEAKSRDPIPRKITKPSPDKQNNTGVVVSAERKKTKVVKVKPSSDAKTHSPYPPEIIKREIRLPSKKAEAYPNQNSSNKKKNTENEMKMTPSPIRTPLVKSKPLTVKSSSSASSVGLFGKRKSEIKFGKKGTAKIVVKKAPSPQSASLPSKPSVSRVMSSSARNYRALKSVSPLKIQCRIHKAEPKQLKIPEVKANTLHVVKTETLDKTLESVQTGDIIQSLCPPQSLESPESLSLSNSLSSSHGEDLEESEYTDSEEEDFDSENDEILSMEELETSKETHNWTRSKGGVILSEDKKCELGKSKFRRGRVVDLQCEDNGPRRLRFRRGRVLGENEEGKRDTRRKFKKREVDNDENGTSPSSEKVVLKHQDVQGKKDAQGLFNNVIEETASKLVESRKSKVKALVGAFETVISLQESKPSTPAGT